jgi:alkanesulfonate monooxygenase
MPISDSVWHKQLSELEARPTVYWLHPMKNYKTFCPYLVGSYDEVAAELSCYLALGAGTFILDVPFDSEELAHTIETFRRALDPARNQIEPVENLT